MLNEAALRNRARTAVQRGQLLARRPDRVLAGPGVGAPCALCARPVSKDQMQFEIAFTPEGEAPGSDLVRLHVRCFLVWEVEQPDAVQAGVIAGSPANARATVSTRVASSRRTMSAVRLSGRVPTLSRR
jgi:hypothetical protein